MASFNIVNYSLRPNKSIQRSLVFDGIKTLQACLNIDELIYIGFGSIWFTDFTLAHRELRIRDMISIEGDEIGAKRANFNRPFKTVRIESGFSNDVIPKLLLDKKLQSKPWLMWLDYDRSLEESTVDDIRAVIEGAPQNSIFLITINASGGPIAKAPKNRPQRIKSLLGAVVPDDLSQDACQEDRLPSTLGKLLEDFMISTAVSAARPGGFVPAFRLIYKDGTPMVTVGGLLPAKGAVPAAREATTSVTWPGFPSIPIIAPHLTLREAAVLQAELPRKRSLDRKAVQRLGFDLEEEQIKAFERYYRYYPAFAQITT
jgi:hypothetical protein